MKKKRCISYVLAVIVSISLVNLLTACSMASEKIPIPTVKDSVYIYDEDNIIEDDVEQNLNKMLVELEEKTEAEFAVVSVESLLNRSIEDYANNLFNTLEIGKKGQDNGILLLISRSDTKVRLEIGRGLEGCLNDSKCGRILDDYFVPYRDSDEYTKATELTVKAVLNVLTSEYNITIEGLDSQEAINSEETELEEDNILLTIILIIVILLMVEWITGIFFGDGFGDGIIFAILSSGGSSNSSSSGSSRGGFGGGFGGGFSGGGGASR